METKRNDSKILKFIIGAFGAIAICCFVLLLMPLWIEGVPNTVYVQDYFLAITGIAFFFGLLYSYFFKSRKASSERSLMSRILSGFSALGIAVISFSIVEVIELNDFNLAWVGIVVSGVFVLSLILD